MSHTLPLLYTDTDDFEIGGGGPTQTAGVLRM